MEKILCAIKKMRAVKGPSCQPTGVIAEEELKQREQKKRICDGLGVLKWIRASEKKCIILGWMKICVC